MWHFFQNYCKDYENIENYEKAKKDNFKGWECHHRLETHTSDGERRLVDITKKELIALNMYYNRPAEELIFLTLKEHSTFKKGKQFSEEHKKKLSEARKGENNHNYGKHLSEETKNKISYAKKGKQFSEEHKKKLSEAHKGKPKTEETRNKMSEARKGTHWYNDGKISKRAYECPEGFVPGRL